MPGSMNLNHARSRIGAPLCVEIDGCGRDGLLSSASPNGRNLSLGPTALMVEEKHRA